MMIKQYLSFGWEIPPEELNYQMSFKNLYVSVRESLSSLLKNKSGKNSQKHANNVYIKVPSLIGAFIDYKVMVDEGKDLFGRPTLESEQIQELYVRSLKAAKSAFNLEESSLKMFDEVFAKSPQELYRLICSSEKDEYTWSASEPRKIVTLLNRIDTDIDLVVGAAHGAIRSGLLLSNLLNSDVYFVRFSRFKYIDEKPKISQTDRVHMESYRGKGVLAFDEDVAVGRTVKELKSAVSQLTSSYRDAAVLCYRGSPYKPDYVGLFSHA